MWFLKIASIKGQNRHANIYDNRSIRLTCLAIRTKCSLVNSWLHWSSCCLWVWIPVTLWLWVLLSVSTAWWPILHVQLIIRTGLRRIKALVCHLYSIIKLLTFPSHSVIFNFTIPLQSNPSSQISSLIWILYPLSSLLSIYSSLKPLGSFIVHVIGFWERNLDVQGFFQ